MRCNNTSSCDLLIWNFPPFLVKIPSQFVFVAPLSPCTPMQYVLSYTFFCKIREAFNSALASRSNSSLVSTTSFINSNSFSSSLLMYWTSYSYLSCFLNSSSSSGSRILWGFSAFLFCSLDFLYLLLSWWFDLLN